MATETLILHSDLNCYYASVEMNEHPELRGKKVAVCGSTENRHGIVLTANYPAKRSGVKTGMANWQAKQACTDLIMVDPHYDLYLRYSKIVRSIYKRYADCIEPFGMDENWISIPCCKSIDQDGLKLAEDIRKTVREETGLTVSIGVSFSKTFAKDILVEADRFDDPLDKDQINALLFWFRDKLLSKYPLVVGEMISIDFMNKTIEYFTIDDILGPYSCYGGASNVADTMNGPACKQVMQQEFNLLVVICPLIIMFDKNDWKQLP